MSSHNEDGTIGVGGATTGDAQVDESNARIAADRVQKARQIVAHYKTLLEQARAADADAKAAGEKRLLAATNAPAVAPATPPVAVPPPAAPAAGADKSAAARTTDAAPAPAVSANKPTLTGDQMKAFYKSAGEAYGKKDWAGVETSLKPLLAGSGDSIKDADRANLYYRLGTAYDNDNKPAEADAAYSEAVRLGVKDDALLNELATVQYSENKFAEAENSEREAIKSKGTDPSYFFNLGLICMAQKKYKDAEMAYRSALHLDPNNAQLKKHLDDAVAAQKKP